MEELRMEMEGRSGKGSDTSTTTMYDGKYKFVPEIFEEEKPLKCNRKPAEISYTNLSHNFPYHRFQLYLSYQNETRRLKRLQAVIKGDDVPGLETYSDEYLKHEFSSVYGGLDEESEAFSKLFKNFKESRLEDVTEWIMYENDVRENPSRESMDISYPEITKEFTCEELDYFNSVVTGPSESGKDWFILPRKNLSTQEIVALKSKPVNLAFFDPELSHCSGGRVIPPQAISREDRGVSQRLAENIYEIICGHQAGIIANEFLIEYKRKFNYTPNFNGLGYINFMEFLVDLNHVVFTQGSGPYNDFMLYPTYLENLISTPMDILWKIYHKLIVLLHFYDGICKTEELVNCFQKLYFIQLPYVSWGFASVDQFVVYLVENVKWRNDYYRVEKASIILRKSDAVGHYVIRVSSQTEKVVEEHKKFVRSAKQQAKPHHVQPQPGLRSDLSEAVVIPPQFVQLGELIPRESDFLEEDCERECVVVYFDSPNQFELALTPTWDSLNQFVRKWSDFYIKITSTTDGDGKRSASVHPKSLKPGLMLVIFSEENLEYVRAQYIAASDFPRKHLVHLVDDGGRTTVYEDNMFYMHRSVMNELRAQAVSACLQHVKPPARKEKGVVVWNKEVSDYAYNLMVPEDGNPRFRVKFLKQSTENTKSWFVTMKSCRKNKKDVGQAILNFGKQFALEEETIEAGKPCKYASNSATGPDCVKKENSPSLNSETVHKAQQVPLKAGLGPSVQSPSKVVTSMQIITSHGSAWDNDWRSSSPPGGKSPAPDHRQHQQKKTPTYQPRSYADTAGSWRTKTLPAVNQVNSNFSALPASFPTLAESASAKTVIRYPAPGAKVQSSFSYAKAASGRHK